MDDKIKQALLSAIEKHQSAHLYQGRDLDAMGRWPGKPHFELCPDLWFWAYQAGNPIYPNMMSVSPTPFWLKGQAFINLSIKMRRLKLRLRELSQVAAAERQMSIASQKLDEAKKDHSAILIDLAEMGIETE